VSRRPKPVSGPPAAPRSSRDRCSLRDAKLLSREVLLASPKTLVHEVLEISDGSRVDWYYVDTPSSVMIVPVTSDHRLVMVRQYRHNLKQDALEFPAGTVRPGEALGAAARRELMEETGFVVAPDALRVLGHFYVLPSETNRYMTVYLGRSAKKVSRPRHDGRLEKYFDMEVRTLGLDEAVAEIGGAIRGVETVTALMLARDTIGVQAPGNLRSRGKAGVIRR
jgi:ADP-ribose diphosphatase